MLNPDQETRRQLVEEKWADLREEVRSARLEGRMARERRCRRFRPLSAMRLALHALMTSRTADRPATPKNL
jgi:hypothetical protein